MKELKLEARVDNLNRVLEFVDEELEILECSPKVQMQIGVAVEELFVNIASYAYEGTAGEACIKIEPDEKNRTVDITFVDSGIPYDPLKKEDPDITLPAEKRGIGGLGIYMVKKSMDAVFYEYADGHNNLTIRKRLD